MSHNDNPQPRPLPHKPLVEAIFELRWALRDAGQGLPPQDPGFQFLLGRYYTSVRQDYPAVEDLPTAQIPQDMTAFAVRHRFRAAKDAWPLTQIGPGILTVNDTQGYKWETFRPRLLAAIAALFDSYPKDITPFLPGVVQLRYINAIPYEPLELSPVRFLSERLHTNISVEPKLFDDAKTAAEPFRLNLNLTYPLAKPKGHGILVFANGAKGFEPRMVFEIIIRSDDALPQQAAGFEQWLNDAHSVAEKWFFTLCRGDLMKSFEGNHANANA